MTSLEMISGCSLASELPNVNMLNINFELNYKKESWTVSTINTFSDVYLLMNVRMKTPYEVLLGL